MRLFHNNTISVLIALIALTACQDQEIDLQIQERQDQEPQKELREVIITAENGDDGTDTRTSIEFNGTKNIVYWTPGDEIKIFSAGESSKFISQNQTPVRIAKFKGLISVITGADDGSDTDFIWGLYPYREDATYSETPGEGSRTATITTTLPNIQMGKENTFEDGTCITIGRSETLSIPFKSVCSGIYITFAEDTDITSVTLQGISGTEALAGRFSVSMQENGNSLTPVIKSVDSPQTKVTVTAPDGGTFKKGKKYYIITLPVTFSQGFKLTARTSSGMEGTCSIPAVGATFTMNSIGNVQNLDSRITSWGQATNEIWYTTSDNSDLRQEYSVDMETGNEVDMANSEAPSSSNGYKGVIRFTAPITEIDENALREQDKLTSVTLPSSVVTIKDMAFDTCENLAEVDLGTGVEEIIGAAFRNCGLVSITLPEGLERIGHDSFNNCVNLTSVAIPSTVQVIGNDFGSVPLMNPFAGCSNLSLFEGAFATTDGKALVQTESGRTYFVSIAYGRMSSQDTYVVPDVQEIVSYAFKGAPFGNVVLPETLRKIGSYAFYNCANLTSVTIPSGVQQINRGAFENCASLEWIKLDCSSIPDTNYQGSPDNLFDVFEGSFCYIYVPADLLNTYKNTFPWSDYEFRYMVANREIRFTTDDPDAVNNLLAGYKADGTHGVTDYFVDGVAEPGMWVVVTDPPYSGAVYFDHDLTEIPNEFFKGMSSILSVEILSDQVTRIGVDAFSGTGISNIVLPASVTEIDEYAFYNTNLSEVILPEGLTAIGTHAFTDCSNLENISLPATYNVADATDIFPFQDCVSLSSFSGNSPMISGDGRCLVDSEGRLFAFAPAGLDGMTYSIPQGVVTIATMNRAPFWEVLMPNTVTIIDQGAFYGCPELESVTFSSSVEDIRDAAFENCVNLEGVIIPSSVQLIRNYAFKGCTSLESVFVDSNTPPQLYENGKTFDETNETFKIYVPVASYEAYCNAVGWREYSSHIHKRFVEQADNEIWYTVTDGSNGADLDFRTLQYVYEEDGQWENDYDELHDCWVATFSFDLTSIPDDSFLNETKLVTITLPESVTSIGNNAFKGCTNLNRIALKDPGSLVSLGEYSLMNCSALTSIGNVDAEGVSELPGLTSLMSSALQNCGVTKLRLPVMSIVRQNAFAGCKLTYLDLPEVTTVQTAGFVNANQLTGLNLPKLKNYGYGPFPSSSSFKTLSFGTDITDMSHNLIQNTAYGNTITTLTLYISALTPPTVSVDTFKQVNSQTQQQLLVIPRIYVHSSCEALYESAWADALACALPEGMTIYQVIQPM